ncbi:TIM barrel protein [Arthrobacter sp. OV608]|uniref:sugar phosphate isomerase/epimerase family protein n=1 Tax=Arthrobacter sp. OV608 TaxID=1882768 RepID=UPI0008D26C9C|nr:TIM barrel protein [Arthrobacter sp. OV608]SEQ44264.1 Sugar phosphate isomerase/epimerase [Arthrobacter sp. OV608]
MPDAEFTTGLCSVTLRGLSIEGVLESASAAGVAGIEWGADVHVHNVDSAARARTGTAAAGLEVLSLGSYYRAGSFGDFRSVMAIATELGAPRIRIWAGGEASGEATPSQWDAAVEDTRRIAGLAQAGGIRLAFEYHGGTLTDSPETTLELLRQVDRSNVGTYWQPAVGLDDGQALESLRCLMEHVVGVHCFSWWPSIERLPLRARRQLWTDVSSMLGTSGKDMDVMLEFVVGDLRENVITDARFLKHVFVEQ